MNEYREYKSASHQESQFPVIVTVHIFAVIVHVISILQHYQSMRPTVLCPKLAHSWPPPKCHLTLTRIVLGLRFKM